MIDITHKNSTLRTATAEAIMRLDEKSIAAIKKNSVPKGDVFSTAKAAGLLAIKNTSAVLPHCHPIPVEFGEVNIGYGEKNTLNITVTVKTIYKTGCEMEALHGATIAALTAYDMLKPLDKNIEIASVKLLDKKGGKSDYVKMDLAHITTAVLVISDSVFEKKKEDSSGKFLAQKLKEHSGRKIKYEVVADDITAIQKKISAFTRSNISLIITTGGTGVSKRDVTVEAVKPLIDMDLPGIMETARGYGQQRMPLAFLSRSIAGFSGDSLILTFPGSRKAVEEYWNAVMPFVVHAFAVRRGLRHD